MLADIPQDKLIGRCARVKYLKKIPLLGRENTVNAIRNVWHEDPVAAALAAYLYLVGGRIAEACRYIYRGKYANDLQTKIEPAEYRTRIRFKSPAVNTLKFETRPDNVHLLTLTVRREKCCKMNNKDFELKNIDYNKFLMRKLEVMSNPDYHDVIIVCGEGNVESNDSPFVDVLSDYLDFLRVRYKIRNSSDELHFQNMELFPISDTRGKLLITKYFGINPHYLRKQSATLFAREMNGNLFELKSKYHWKSNDIVAQYVQEDSKAVMTRQLNFLRASKEWEIIEDKKETNDKNKELISQKEIV